MTSIPVSWPDGHTTQERIGQDWLVAANEAGISIPTGCLGGSCGACEIDVNGKTVRACISTCLLYTSPSPRDYAASRMPSSA